MNNETSLEIRPMRLEDVEEAIAIEKTTFRHPWTKKAFQEALSYNCSLIALIGKKPVGFLMLECHLWQFHIVNFVVRPKHRNKGVGTALISHLIAQLGHEGKTSIIMPLPEEDLEAQKFLRKQGFYLHAKWSYEDGQVADIMKYRHPEALPYTKDVCNMIFAADEEFYQMSFFA